MHSITQQKKNQRTRILLETNQSNVTRIERLLGGLCLGFFVLIWLTSIASPFLFGLALYHRYYKCATAIALETFIAYVPWKKGPLVRQIQRFVGYYAPRYFRSVTILVEEEGEGEGEQQTEKQTFYAIHPHGAFCIGWALLFCNDAMQNVRFCFAPALYASPFFRLFSRCTGNPGSAAKHSMQHYLKQGENVALPPGGFEEATLTSLQQDRVFIKKRTGFIKLCLQTAAATQGKNKTVQVRPVYVFGEKHCYWNVQGGWKTRLALNRYGLPTIFAVGHWAFWLLPKPSVALRIVIGKPLTLPQNNANPTRREEVVSWHNQYMTALTQLFEENKEFAYGSDVAKTTKLEVW